MIKEIKDSPQKAFWFNLCLLTKPNMKFMYAFIHSYGYSKRRNRFLSNWQKKKLIKKCRQVLNRRRWILQPKLGLGFYPPHPVQLYRDDWVNFLECPRFSLLGFSGLCLSLTSHIFIGFLFFFFCPPLIEIERFVSLMETSSLFP